MGVYRVFMLLSKTRTKIYQIFSPKEMEYRKSKLKGDTFFYIDIVFATDSNEFKVYEACELRGRRIGSDCTYDNELCHVEYRNPCYPIAFLKSDPTKPCPYAICNVN